MPVAMPVWGDVVDVERFFKLSRSRTFALVAAKRLVSVRQGKSRLIQMKSVDDYLVAAAAEEQAKGNR